MFMLSSKSRMHHLVWMASGTSAGVIACVGMADPCLAQSTDVAPDTIVVTGKSAPAAPAQTPLTVVQPTTVINRSFIENAINPTTNFDNIVTISPSVSVSPSGSGGDDAKISIRGFQNGQYNTVLDGIPLRSYALSQRSGTFVMTNDLANVSVDRGPGTASTVGDATFGGTIAMQTRAPGPDFYFTPTIGYGSFNTQLYGVELNTGPIHSADGPNLLLDVQHNTSDGYFANDYKRRTNVFAKLEQDLGPYGKITLGINYDDNTRAYFSGASKAQIAAFGPDFGLNNNPASQNYVGYNQWNLKTDFEYLQFQSNLPSGWHVDNKLYTYGYDLNSGLSVGLDPSGNTKNGTVYGASNVPGTLNPITYRSYGDVLAISKDVSFGTLKAGVWAETQPGHRALFNWDMTADRAISTVYDQHMRLSTVQPYAEIDWHPLPNMTVTGGVKYAWVQRGYDSSVDPNTGKPLEYTQAWTKALPSLAVNYKLSPDWSVYAQAAEGFQSPPNALPNTANAEPQTTRNYQVGTVWQGDRVSLAGDLYYIDFNNMISSQSVGGVTSYFNAGGVIYKGVEVEGSIAIGHGFSLYANGSLNSALSRQTNQWIAEAPNATAAAGVTYKRGGLWLSLFDKWTGSRYGDNGQKQPLNAFHQLDFAASYKAPNFIKGAPPITLRLNIDNILNNRQIIDFAGYSGGSKTPLFYTQVGRSISGTVSMPF